MGKWLFVAAGLLALNSCATDVSRQPPHSALIGTVWKTSIDGYALVEVFGTPSWAPAGSPNGSRDLSGPYDEKRIGTTENRVKIVAGYRKGTLMKVVRVVKVPGMLATDGYSPMAIPLNASAPSGKKEIDLGGMYPFPRKDGGTLDPQFAERVRERWKKDE